ncbi:hypothetical protein [Pseudofrankia asymbiotica]|uniref:Uncharacterized protein n=1 Tax=Pseudofrankia asymbiotica TaxID=1834516 RepID=A0A1V2HZS9_9ACTN|nr:hypothetical protein [Pseudofrankia asymbiotica]ONH22319.1 hypothetical protein BL253_35970 [Pseudofrankia asymbiotica]
MIAVRRVAPAPADTPAAGRGHRRNPAPRVATGLVVGLALALTGCGSHDEPAGAAAPARGDPAPGSGQAGGVAGSPGQTAAASPGGGTPRPASDSQAAAAGVVTAYFAEINSASRASRVADVTAAALPGCQACALDVGVTRGFQQRGLRADADPYEITDVTAQPRQGVVVTVTFTATARTVGLLDQAGRRVDAAAGVPARAGTAELTLTGGGWLIQTIRYARR